VKGGRAMDELAGNLELIARHDVGLPDQHSTYWLYWDGTPSGAGTFFIRCVSVSGESEQVALSGDLGSDPDLALAVFRVVSSYPPVTPGRLQQVAQMLRGEHEARLHRPGGVLDQLPRVAYRHLHVISRYHASSLLSRIDRPAGNA
jgi:hypothetical protein